jgi:hypothetical protein
MTGSSVLTEEQREWYRERYGVSYVAIAENHIRPSRRVRRGRARDQMDVDVLGAQRQALDALRKTAITKAYRGR